MILTRLSIEATRAARQAYKESGIRAFFLTRGYQCGAFRDLIPPGDKACRRVESGVVPKGYSIHHLVPLSLGGSNTLDNLALMLDEEHQALHARVIAPQTDGMRPGESRNVSLPVERWFMRFRTR